MSEFEDGLWERLVAEHAADSVALAAPIERHGHRRLLVGGSATALATVSAAAVVGFAATGGAAPAYAMTQNADGSYTFTINDLATAAPELNAKFKQLGIDATVVTATASCPATSTGDITHELMLYPGESSADTLTLYPGHKYLGPGYTGVVGAEQLPDGEIAMAIEAVPPADVPSCFPTQAVKIVQTGSANGVATISAVPVTPSTPVTTTGS